MGDVAAGKVIYVWGYDYKTGNKRLDWGGIKLYL
jgi:hypothetical protein